jgi:Uma2 family endonuclease
MQWQEICDNPLFSDLPFKIETNRWGKIEMSPASNRHSRYQGLITRLLDHRLADGEAIPKCSIQTTDGVKVADVVWASADFLQRNRFDNPYSESPEIVVEILSPSNTLAEMLKKKDRYFASGAQEVWLCQEDGMLRFYNKQNRLAHSQYAPGFPTRLELPFA